MSGLLRGAVRSLEPEHLVAWVIRAHAAPVAMACGLALLVSTIPGAVARWWVGPRTAWHAVAAACLAAAGAMATGRTDPASLAPALAPHSAAVWALVWVGIAAPLVEELLFRGALQQALVRRVHPALAVALSSLVFMVAHLEGGAPPFHLALGIGFGLCAALSGALLPAIAAHIAWNLASVTAGIAGAPPWWVAALVAALGVALAAAGTHRAQGSDER